MAIQIPGTELNYLTGDAALFKFNVPAGQEKAIESLGPGLSPLPLLLPLPLPPPPPPPFFLITNLDPQKALV